MKTRGVIVGAGIIGSALAYELSKRGIDGIHVVDPDLSGGLSSTERNAGGVRHLWSQQVNADMARLSIQLFENIREEIGFQQTGYLWLYAKNKAAEGDRLLEVTRKRGLSYEKISVPELQKRWPFLDKTDDLAFAIFGSKDGLINSNSLKTFYRKEAKKLGVTFHNQTVVIGLAETESKAQIKVAKVKDNEAAEKFLVGFQSEKECETWEAEFVVLCAGAWTSHLLSPLVSDPLIKPVRRQIAVFKADDFNLNAYGMVVDTSGVYFHPEGGNILGGLVLKHELPGFRFDMDSDFFESHIWPALYERSSQFERLKLLSGWGGLYSYTPDTTGILGKIPGFSCLYESHSFTGRGVMQSYGAALAMADLITQKRFESFDAACLSRNRFSQGSSALLPESLHI